MEIDGGNVVRKKQKMVAKSTKKMMGNGVINAAPLESTADDRASATDYTWVESELINGKLARVSTLCDHESPPIDLEAAIPIKGSPNANTRSKAKVITFFSPGLSPAKPRDTKNRLLHFAVKLLHLREWGTDMMRTSCEACELRANLRVDRVGNSGRLAVLGMVMTWAGYDIGSGGHECASSVGSASQANLWGQSTSCELRANLGVDRVGNSGWLGMSSKMYSRGSGSTKSYLMKWRSCRLAVLGLVMTWAGYDIRSRGHECASSVGSASQANLWGQSTC
nr:hypothetical protein Iba_chr10dCG13450 [Ipomoea batatas]